MEVRSAQFHLAVHDPAQLPRDGLPQIAIAGRSNVGKSSLINTILRRKKLAKISQTPGKTRTVNFFLVNERIWLVDLPGYGYAKVSKSVSAWWGTLIRRYLESEKDLRAMLVLLDVRREPSEHDHELCGWLEMIGIHWIPVLTKVDKLSKNELAKQKRLIAEAIDRSEEDLILFSASKNRGVRETWSAIEARL